MTYSDMRKAILTGTFDANLTQLAADLHAREQALANDRAHTLQPGDTITVNGLRPQYINGQEATVIRVNKTRAVVRFNNSDRAGRFADEDITVPLTSMQLVTSGNGGSTAPATPPASSHRMRQGTPVQIPDFQLDWREQDKWFQEYRKNKEIISFPVADGYANYEVRGNTLHHIPINDAYKAHPTLLRGITKHEVNAMLERDRRMAEHFKRPT